MEIINRPTYLRPTAKMLM